MIVKWLTKYYYKWDSFRAFQNVLLEIEDTLWSNYGQEVKGTGWLYNHLNNMFFLLKHWMLHTIHGFSTRIIVKHHDGFVEQYDTQMWSSGIYLNSNENEWPISFIPIVFLKFSITSNFNISPSMSISQCSGLDNHDIRHNGASTQFRMRLCMFWTKFRRISHIKFQVYLVIPYSSTNN